MIGFTMMIWFVSIVLIFVSIPLLRGRYSAMHGKVFDYTHDKEGYANVIVKPIRKGMRILYVG